MALITEIIQEEGKATITHTYSDSGFKIERDGILYDEAYDLTEYAEERIYTETTILIGYEYDEEGNLIENTENINEEATEVDYIEALAKLGVESDE